MSTNSVFMEMNLARLRHYSNKIAGVMKAPYTPHVAEDSALPGGVPIARALSVPAVGGATVFPTTRRPETHHFIKHEMGHHVDFAHGKAPFLKGLQGWGGDPANRLRATMQSEWSANDKFLRRGSVHAKATQRLGIRSGDVHPGRLKWAIQQMKSAMRNSYDALKTTMTSRQRKDQLLRYMRFRRGLKINPLTAGVHL